MMMMMMMSISWTTTVIMAARHLCWPPAILFYRCSLDLYFSPPYLRGRLADRHQTLSHVRQLPRFKEVGQKVGTSRLYREHLRKTTRHRPEKGSANYGQTNLIRCTLVHKRRKKDRRTSDPSNGRPSGWAMPRIYFSLHCAVFPLPWKWLGTSYPFCSSPLVFRLSALLLPTRPGQKFAAGSKLFSVPPAAL